MLLSSSRAEKVKDDKAPTSTRMRASTGRSGQPRTQRLASGGGGGDDGGSDGGGADGGGGTGGGDGSGEGGGEGGGMGGGGVGGGGAAGGDGGGEGGGGRSHPMMSSPPHPTHVGSV